MEADKEGTRGSGEAVLVPDGDPASLKAKLEPWKEIVLQLDDVLLWRKPALLYTAFASMTAAFVIIWFVEPPLLTLLGVLGLCASLLDFAAPAIASKLLSTGEWSGEQERHLEDVALRLECTKRRACNAYDTLLFWKINKPALYLAATVGALLVVAWLGSCLDNLWLMYTVAVIITFLPGLLHHKVCERCIQVVQSRFQALLSKAQKSKKQQ